MAAAERGRGGMVGVYLKIQPSKSTNKKNENLRGLNLGGLRTCYFLDSIWRPSEGAGIY